MKLPETFAGATFDSRAVKPGMLFIALKGEKADGHDFIPQALAAGASGIIDGYDELAEAARAYRRTLAAKVIGVTGSAGKTTAKEMLRAFLSRIGKTHATDKNYNNHIGLPQTILNCPRDAEFLVVEMGTNHPGEIAALCDIAEPDAGLVTSIGTAHLEFFRTQENIALEKGELLRRAREFAGVSSECDQLETLRRLRPSGLAVVDPDVKWIEDALSENLPGAHNVSNAALAFAMAAHYGLSREDAADALRGLVLPGQRWKVLAVGGATIVNDAYNANPSSMSVALDTFVQKYGGRRIAVLGDMFELGEASERLHRGIGAKVGGMLAKGELDLLLAVGEQSCNWMAGEAEKFADARQICRVADAAGAKAALSSLLREGDCALLKASRGMKLECAIPEMQ